MNRTLLALATVTTATAFVAPTQAAAPLPPTGLKCAFNSATDVTREPGFQFGDLRGGPLVTLEAGTLTCTIHVNNNSHDGPSVAGASGPTVGGLAAVVPAQSVSYPATAADIVSLCTQWDGDSGTLYWTSPNPAVPTELGSWSTDAGASCGEALSIEPNDPECSIWKAIDSRLGTNIAEIWQDCEPYEELPLPDSGTAMNYCVGVMHGQGSCDAGSTVTSVSSTSQDVIPFSRGSTISWDCAKQAAMAKISYTLTNGSGSFEVIC